MNTFPNFLLSEGVLHKSIGARKASGLQFKSITSELEHLYSSSSPPATRFKTWRMPSTGKPCHNCRRRRLRCDRSWPTCHKCAVSGQECLGYGKVFVWTQGIDSNGNLRPSPPGRRGAVDVTRSPSPGSLYNSASAPASTPIPRNHTPPTTGYHRTNGSPRLNARRPPTAESISGATAALTDPIFQDLDKNSRYYLAYCKSPTSCVNVGPLILGPHA